MPPDAPKISNAQQKFLHSLAVKKYRYQERRFLVEGEKIVAELLAQARVRVSAVYGLEKWAMANESLLQAHQGKFTELSESELRKISTLSTPNAVLAVAEMPDEPLDTGLPERHFCFYLDEIQDPGNLGTILRIADWFGWPAVYCGPGCVDPYSPKVVQSGMGAVLRVKTWECGLPQLLERRPDIPVLGAVLGAENVFETALPDHGLLVLGNESRGISDKIEAQLSQRITIPKHPEGGAESLNAAVAAGILAAICSGSRLSAVVRR